MLLANRGHSLLHSAPSVCHQGAGTLVPPLPSRRRHSACRGSVTVSSAPRAEQAPQQQQQEALAPSSRSESDAFVAAAQRLQGMVQCCGDGEDELLDTYLSEESPYVKLQAQVAVGGLLLSTSAFIATLVGQDPWGGASFSWDTLEAAALGAAIAAPLAALRAWSWSPEASQQLMPQLSDMRQVQVDQVGAWFNNMQPWQISVMMALEVLPVVVLLLPATQGCLLGSADMFARMSSGYELGDDLPVLSNQPWLQFMCLSFTAGIAAFGRGMELSFTEPEVVVVKDAMENADRYYRVMATGVQRRMAEAQYAALAFRSVAQAWFDVRAEACLAAAGLCAADVMALGGLWYGTHSLVAPALAGLALNAVDYANMYELIKKREVKAAAQTKQSKSGGSSGSARSSSEK